WRGVREGWPGFPESQAGRRGVTERPKTAKRRGPRRWGPKSEIRDPKPETNPKRQAENDENHCPPAGFEHSAIGILGLFRVSSFEFRVFMLRMAEVPGYAPAVVGVATTGRRRRASLCGGRRDAGAGHFWDIGPAVNVLAGANPNGCAGFRPAIPGNVKGGDDAPAVGRGRQHPQEWEVL